MHLAFFSLSSSIIIFLKTCGPLPIVRQGMKREIEDEIYYVFENKIEPQSVATDIDLNSSCYVSQYLAV